MNSLLEKEGFGGKFQMAYFDPPYGVRYGSNFQPFVSRRDVQDGRDNDLSREPETLKAFRDTWELGIHSYLSYIRDRLWLLRDLLNDTGSCFVQISDENLHHVTEVLDEVFGPENRCGIISFAKTTGATSQLLASTADYLVWYARDRTQVKYRQLFLSKVLGGEGASAYTRVELPGGTRRPCTKAERDDSSLLPEGSRIYRIDNLTSQRPPGDFPVDLHGRTFRPNKGYWKTGQEGMQRLAWANRLEATSGGLYYVRYFDDFPVYPLSNYWSDTGIAGFASDKVYVVQTSPKVVQRCLLMTTDPGDLVFDPTCGAGTTAWVAEKWGRRWVTCDTSRVATTLARQRLITAAFDYYKLENPGLGVRGGFTYEQVPHLTLRSIATNPQLRDGMSKPEMEEAVTRYAPSEHLYDRPAVEADKVRVAGPFTVEAVPAPVVAPIETFEHAQVSGEGSSRSGETLRQSEWRDELLKTGVRGKGGQMLRFSRVEPLAGATYLHADAEVSSDDPHSAFSGQRAVVCFGPEHAPMEQRLVELAWEEARSIKPRPDILLFVAFSFDPEAAKDIDELDPGKAGMKFLRVEMNDDLATQDLKKKRSTSESFWLIGQPDISVRRLAKGEDKGKVEVEVHGFDYFDLKRGQVVSGGADRIAVWLLDTDYDGRSLYPRQVFFPMADEDKGWTKLAKSLQAEIDEEKIAAFHGSCSLPFEPGKWRRIAVKLVDDRGIESLVIRNLDEVLKG